MCLANVTDGHPSSSATCAGVVPVYPSVDSVAASTRSGLARWIAAARTLAVDRASEPLSASSLTRMAFAAPIASAVRRPETSLFGAIETRVTSPPPAASARRRPISTPYASESSRMSLP